MPIGFVGRHRLLNGKAHALQGDDDASDGLKADKLLVNFIRHFRADSLDLRQPSWVVFDHRKGLLMELLHNAPGNDFPHALDEPARQKQYDALIVLRHFGFHAHNFKLFAVSLMRGIAAVKADILPRLD